MRIFEIFQWLKVKNLRCINKSALIGVKGEAEEEEKEIKFSERFGYVHISTHMYNRANVLLIRLYRVCRGSQTPEI